MQNNDENFAFCLRLVKPFAFLKFPPAEHRRDETMEFLAQTLVDACTSREIAEFVAKEVLRNEEQFPAPATLRNVLRDNDYLLEDEAREREQRIDRQIAKEREERQRSRGEAA